MKIKKIFLGLSSALMLLCSCNEITVPPIMGNGGQTGNKAPEEQENGGTVISDPVDTYLVLSSIGLFEGQKGRNIEDKMLENAVVFTAKPGEDLPTKDQITVIDGSKGEFDSWVSYEGTGFPTVYTTVPQVAGKILYATFKNGEGNSTGSSSGTTTPESLTTIYLDATHKLNEGEDLTWASGGAAVTMYVWSASSGDYDWIKMNNGGSGIFIGSVNIDKYTNVIFLRHDASKAASFEDDGYWNKTGNLLFVAERNCFKITSWNDGGYWTTK